MGESREAVRAAQGALAVAVIALAVGLVAIAMPIMGIGAGPRQSTTTVPSQVAAVDQTPTTRIITMEWEATLPSLQDRWFPQNIIINEGDMIVLTLIVNDTDGAHTFTMIAPTGPNGMLQLTQINMSMVGQWMYHPPAESGPQFGIEVAGAPVGCDLMGQNVTCNYSNNLPDGTCSMTGCTIAGGCSINGGALGPCTGSWMLSKNQTEIAEIQTTVTLGPFTAPGIYRFFCSYHQEIGMIGWLTVQSNEAYQPPSSTTTTLTPSLLSSDIKFRTTDITSA
jgi:hypothetical protein